MSDIQAKIHGKINIPGKCFTVSYIHTLLLPLRISWICFKPIFASCTLLYNLNCTDNKSLGRVVSMKTKSNVLIHFKRWHLKSAIEVGRNKCELTGRDQTDVFFKSKDCILRLLCRALTLAPQRTPPRGRRQQLWLGQTARVPREELWAPCLVSRSKMQADVVNQT